MKRLVYLALIAINLTACGYPTDTPRGSWARGGDLSWLSEMEHDGVVFRDSLGRPQDCIELLRGYGMNAVRLRVWVNHSTGWSNKPDVLALAKRAAKSGQRIMIDFHYSDFFADPSHQTIPADWQGYDYRLLREAVFEHTLDVLYALKEEGVSPEWVQIGNETPNGMLWPVGLVGQDCTDEQWDHYAGFTTAGYKAVKEAFPRAQVIVHVDNAYEYRDWFFRALIEHGAQFDIIGLSHYPMMEAWSGLPWQEMNRRAEANIRQLIATFHRPVMIAEVGMANGEGMMVNGRWQPMPYDSIAALADVVMTDFVNRIMPIDSCVGIFYWEPECYGGWRPAEYIPLGWGGYEMGSFTPNGQPSPALKTLLKTSQLDD